MRRRAALGLVLLLAACGRPEIAPPALPDSPFAPMPEAHANNAVAALRIGGRDRLYSFMGLKAGKTHEDISTAAFEYDVAADRWRRLPPVPVPEGRLAAAATALGGKVWLFGGYSVAADGHEVSTPHVLSLDPATDTWRRHADMPRPVDDSVALPYAGRYVYLVSGWHMDGNVAGVQVYDTVEGIWFNATDFPGIPVFGHAGGLVGDHIVVIDGVAVLGERDGKRDFGLVAQAWVGEINPDDPSDIAWRRVNDHGGAPLYRAAGTGAAELGLALFAGGSTRAYNFSGTGYDGHPAEPSARVFGYDPVNDIWLGFADKPIASMDHRGLLAADNAFWTLGGMIAGQRVSPLLDRFEAIE